LIQVIAQGKSIKEESSICRRGENSLPFFGLVHVCGGSAFFKSDPSGEIDVNQGDTILLIPGIAHSYGAKPGCTWNECWILLNEDCVNKRLFSARYPVLRNSYTDLWNELYNLDINEDRKNALAVALFGLSAAFAMKPQSTHKFTISADKIVAAMSLEISNTFFNFDAAAITTGYSAVHMRRIFKFETGYAPVEYFNRLKIEEAKRKLLYTSKPIREIALELGWRNEDYFRKVFKNIEGQSPYHWRKMNKSLDRRFY
jgi:AraC-like DNA-binding protein